MSWETIIVAIIAVIPAVLVYLGSKKQNKADAADKISSAWDKLSENLEERVAKLAARVDEQDKMLSNQSTRLSEQDDIIARQNETIAQQNALILKQTERIAAQDRLIAEQGQMILLLEKQLEQANIRPATKKQ